jgi:hypothetical protein
MNANNNASTTEIKPVKEMTAADAAKLVKRTIIVPGKEGEEPTTKEVAIKESEVFGFKEYGDHVVVVTQDGQKFTGNK